MTIPNCPPKRLSLLVLLAFSLGACTTEITVDLPTQPRQLVVEGRISTGTPPVVAISWSEDYFSTFGMESLGALYRGGAEVWVDVTGDLSGGGSGAMEARPLTELCSSDFPPSALPEIAAAMGVSVEILLAYDLCFYTATDWVGVHGATYTLHVMLEEAEAVASTRLHQPVALDAVWFEVQSTEITGTLTDSLGFLYAGLTDPDTAGNAYRWGAQRLNLRPGSGPNAGQAMDAEILYPFGSVTDDALFNGMTFEFWYFRADSPEDNALDSTQTSAASERRGFFQVGDTVRVEWSHIDLGVFRALDSYELQIASQANPFAAPADLQSNIDGGLGLWAGYSTTFDTVFCAL
jgi:hypothetical protein